LRRSAIGLLAVPLLLWLLSLSGARPGLAQEPYPVSAVYSGSADVAAASLNIRTGPHVSYSAVAFLFEGQRVAVVGRNTAATWAQIELPNGFRGWVNVRYLRLSLPLSFLPVVAPPTANATGLVTDEGLTLFFGPGWVYRAVALLQPGDVVRLLGRDVRADWYYVALADGRTGWAPGNGPLLPTVFIQDLPITVPLLDYVPDGLADFYRLYTGPGYLYQYVEEMAVGQSVALIGRNDDGTWVRVRLADGREGWLDAAVLSLPLPPEMLPPLPEGPDTPTPSPTAPAATPSPAATAIPPTPTAIPPTASPVPPTPTDVPTATPLPTATVAPTATVVPTVAPATPDATGIPAPSPDANLTAFYFIYPLPDTNTVPLVALTPGQQLGLLGRTADGAWVNVAFGQGERGWVLAQLLQADVNVALLPVVEP
jgi:uncharacterized protein YgiM (DUF1202 family)